MSDRKYRQRGYMDDDRNERPKRPRQQPPQGRIEGAPRGRGVGLPTDVVFKCALCGTKVQAAGEIEKDRTCEKCGKPLHTCTNCTFFNTSSRFECRKPIEARIESKAKANDCPHFQPKTIRDLRSRDVELPAASPSPKVPNDARAAFDALFKK